jgi:hypothetical protein
MYNTKASTIRVPIFEKAEVMIMYRTFVYVTIEKIF